MGDSASKSHLFDIIIVHKLDRFSRDSLESFTSKAILKRHKVRLISVQEPVVGSDAPEDAFMEHILVGMAEFYSKNLAREIKKGLTERIRQGFLVFRPPYGYRREVVEKQQGHKRIRTISRPVIDHAAAGVVQRIFELCDRGVGYKEITKILNNDGLRTAQGKRFASNHIYWILRNKAYVGVLEYNFRERYGAVEPMTIPGFYPGIIDQELFDRVQEKLRLSAANWRNSYTNRTTYLLSGLVVCEHAVIVILAQPPRVENFITTAVALISKAAKKLALRGSSTRTNWRARLGQDPGRNPDVRRILNLHPAGDGNLAKVGRQPRRSKRRSELALNDLQSRLQRWENALESGELSIEHAAERIKELHEQRQELLKKKQALDRDRPGVKTDLRNSDSANGRLHCRNAAPLSGETNRRKKGISARGRKGGESARR